VARQSSLARQRRSANLRDFRSRQAPWDILLLDEVTVDLDVLVRGDLIDFLIAESKERNATIVYCASPARTVDVCRR
jgi:ABC-type uncharacterized transport system ATPase subunit